MSMRALLAAAIVASVAGCGGGGQLEVRLVAPAGVVADADLAQFERKTGCRVDLRVYDANEDVEAIAERRDADVVARPPPDGEAPHMAEQLVRATLRNGVVVTVPRRVVAALDPVETRPAGRRELSWLIRDDGDNDACAHRWLAYATSQ